MKIIIRILLLLSFVLTMFGAVAQQIPNSNQYLVNRYLLSPSFAGSSETSQVFIGYRNSWSSFIDAPKPVCSVLLCLFPIKFGWVVKLFPTIQAFLTIFMRTSVTPIIWKLVMIK